MISSIVADPLATIPSRLNVYLLGRFHAGMCISVTLITAT
ncbi:hypothetical protein SAMN05444166_2443 [Singulisphaera sp. GP187]|nr:hypothetical protein SAMN05444166_2443 [Singulisphaera sp. GP187]